MNINNKGFSLVETLIVMSIAGVSVAGLFKASQQALNTYKIVQGQQETGKLKESVYKILSNNCKETVHPNNLSPLTPPVTRLQRVTELKSLTGKVLFNVDPSNVSKNKKKFGEYIQVADMRLQDKQTFYLYYRYISTSLGDKQTRNNQTCTKTDLKGCYHLSCEMDYECVDGDCNDTSDEVKDPCRSLNCSVSETGLENKVCTGNKVLVSFTGNEEDCLGCPVGQILIGIKTINGVKKPECLQINPCVQGEVAVSTELKTGENTEYKVKCQTVVCDNGKTLKVDAHGNLACKTICHGGQIPKPPPNEDECHCPSDSMKITGTGNCVCKDDRVKNENTGNCECRPGETVDSAGLCRCPGNAFYDNNNGKCFCLPYKDPVALNCSCYPGNSCPGNKKEWRGKQVCCEDPPRESDRPW